MGRASRKRAERRAGGDPMGGAPTAPDPQERIFEALAGGRVRRPPYRVPPAGAAAGLGRLRELDTTRSDLEEAIRQEVIALVGLGTDWGSVGRALGVSRQAARRRFSC